MTERVQCPDRDEIRSIASDGTEGDQREQAQRVSSHWASCRDEVFAALDEPDVRRWSRGHVLPALSPSEGHTLAARILQWPADLSPSRRDRTTAMLVAHLGADDLALNLVMLAKSNASSALWERLSKSGSQAVLEAAWRVLSSEDVVARETTLHRLVLDPYGPEYLSREQQNSLLILALDDSDPEIRGLAAEVIASDMPDRLLDRGTRMALDDEERVRMAYWRTLFVHQPEDAVEQASRLSLDASIAHPARRTALLALGENRATRTVAPVLQALLTGQDQVLANDAAQLMWRWHRAPDIASAAAQSPFSNVRELAERLLHPERGSPAAGGSRPGDPTRTTDILDQISPSAEWRGPDPDRDDAS